MSTSVSLEAEAPAPDWIARFVDDIPTGVALFDPELRYVAANASWVKAFHLAAVPLAGQRHDEVDPAGGSQFAELQQRAAAGENVSVPVGCWVIREVVRQMQVWQMLYGRDMLDWVSINVSARQFNDPSLLLATLSEINDSGFPLDRLKLEITESAVMRSPELTRTVLGELQDIGIRIALDDFGTGYSALGVLRHYSVDTIKIDRDFTKRLDTHDGRELVLALLKIARIYGAAVVAEGVETSAQQAILQEAGCDFAQGYLFAKPMAGSLFGAYALTHLVEGVVLDEAAAD